MNRKGNIHRELHKRLNFPLAAQLNVSTNLNLQECINSPSTYNPGTNMVISRLPHIYRPWISVPPAQLRLYEHSSGDCRRLLDGGVFASEERRRALVAAATPARRERGRQPDFGCSSRFRRDRSLSPFQDLENSTRRNRSRVRFEDDRPSTQRTRAEPERTPRRKKVVATPGQHINHPAVA
jgi:hypothetical protein